jgi:hypothetical protein
MDTKNLIEAANRLVKAGFYMSKSARRDHEPDLLLIDAAEEIDRLRKELVEMERRKDCGYLERNRVVALLAKCFPSGITKTAIDGWSDDWHGCVYIELPTGQVSWHFHDTHAYLFEGLPPYEGTWDGHVTSEKYRRVAEVVPDSSAAEIERLRRAIVWLGTEANALDFWAPNRFSFNYEHGKFRHYVHAGTDSSLIAAVLRAMEATNAA